MRGHGLTADWSWTGRGCGHSPASARTLPVHCPDASRMLPGRCREIARMLRGCYAGHCTGRCADVTADATAVVAPDATPDVARTLRGLRLYFLIRGWCHPKIKAFKFQKAATNHVRLNVSNWMMMGALTGRSETGSETEQVGSGMNGRRRSCARFWNDR